MARSQTPREPTLVSDPVVDAYKKGIDRTLLRENLKGAQTSESTAQAIDVLDKNPLIGRPVHEDMRELVIGRQSRGYVALYRYVAEIDTVFVLALRGQREAGYTKT